MRGFSSLALPAVLAAVGALVSAAPAAAAPLVVYDDQLRNGFESWSWGAAGSYSFTQTVVVRSGSGVSLTPNGWNAISVRRPAAIDPAQYDRLELWVHGGASSGQELQIGLQSDGTGVGNVVSLDGFIAGGGVAAGEWRRVEVSFAALGVTTASFNRLFIADGDGQPDATVYFDDFRLLENDAPPPPPSALTVVVDPALDRRPVDPRLFGVNFGSVAQANDLRWPVRRWGGNVTTRYNYLNDMANHGADWFFYTYDEGPGNAADNYIAETWAAGGEPLLTVPTIGWTAKDFLPGEPRWSFSVQKYGQQTATECTATNNAPWCQPDAGNGRGVGGGFVVNDPTDTSRTIGPAHDTGWMSHLAAVAAASSRPKVRLFALDNESGLWHDTHRDVHPQKVTYQELWDRTRDYAAAMKAHDPDAQLFGPVTWGYCDLYFSAADDCTAGPDQAAHGGTPLLRWYLQQLGSYAAANAGLRLIDWIDLHYYPQSWPNADVALSDDESPEVAARRLRSIKSLYDPTYVDESWIGMAQHANRPPIQLLPTVRAWRDQHLPGARIAITEYNWGNDDGLSSAIAQAEVLAVFAREGVSLATRWVAPDAGTLMEDVFRLYLDYDGAGARVAGHSVRAVSSDVDRVGAYAVAGSGATNGKLFLLLFNKSTAVTEVELTVPNGTFTGAPGTLYRIDGSSPGDGPQASGPVTPAGSAIDVVLPARSANLLVMPVARRAEGSFYTLAPCRLLDTRLANGPAGGPPLRHAVQRVLPVAGRCGVPATAIALAVNVTVVPVGGGGSVGMWPLDVGERPTSVVHFASGVNRASLAVLPVARDGFASLVAKATVAGGGNVHLLIDVTGYFE